MEWIGWFKTSVRHSHSTPRKIAEEGHISFTWRRKPEIMILDINKIDAEKLSLNTADVT
jgi:hypothetical protein